MDCVCSRCFPGNGHIDMLQCCCSKLAGSQEVPCLHTISHSVLCQHYHSSFTQFPSHFCSPSWWVSETSWTPVWRLMTWVDCAACVCWVLLGRDRKKKDSTMGGGRASKSQRKTWREEGGVKSVPCSACMLRWIEGKTSLVLCYRNIVVAWGLGSTSTDG